MVKWQSCKKDSSENTCKIKWPNKDALIEGDRSTHWELGTYRNGTFTSDDGRIKIPVKPALVQERIEVL